MNIINKVFSLVVVLVLYSTQTKATILSGTCGDNAFFVLNDDGLLHVYGSGEMSDFATPWSVVHSQIKNVTIGDGITSVGNSSFAGCSNIVNVELPNTLIRIGDNAFSNCEGLVSINIPSNLTYIGSQAFRLCSKLSSEIVIPGGVRYIRAGTFQYCKSLRNVVIQDGVETIDDEAFHWCYGLAKINFPSSLKKIGVGAFNDCHNIKELVFKEGLTEIGSEAFINCKGIIKLVTPSTLVSIGKSAFMHCTSLSELSLANGLQSIGMFAFRGCNSLTSLKIPDSVNFIGESAFSGPETGSDRPSFSVVQIGNGLKEISSVFTGPNSPSIDTLVIGNSITSIYDGASIFGSDQGSPVLYPKCFLITNNIVTLSSSIYTPRSYYVRNAPTCSIFVADSTLYDAQETYGVRNIINSVPNIEEYTGNAPNINLTSHLSGYSISIDPFYYNVGTYTSMKVNFSKDDFSSTINVPCNYTITKAPLTIIANDKSIYYGEEIPALDCTYIGLKNNETPEYALSTLPALVTSAKKGSDVGTYEINISNAAAKNYSLSYKSGTITIKKATQKITWNQTFDNGYIGDAIELNASSSCGLLISYISSDESVAFVTKENGKQILHLIKEGTVKISATQLGDSNHEAAEEINKMIQVIARMATSISLSQTAATIKVGEHVTLTATIKPESTINKVVSWLSSDTSVATVDNNGVVTAVKAGTATITASTTDGTNLSATCKVTVDPVLATSISLSRTSASIKSGATLQLTCTLKPDNVTSKDVKWSSSNTSIATVDSKGVVTAVKVGTATITATTTDGTNLSATCKVTVDPVLATSISLNHTSASIKSGAILQLTCTLKPDNVTSKTVKWSSSDTGIATVDNNGVVTAVKVGTATITATTTDGSNLSATCKVTVNPVLATSISLSQASASIKMGGTLQLTYTLKPDNVTSKAVKWSSSNTGIATVDNNGMVTAVKVGTATITATTTDGSNLSATCKVTVDPILATSISISSSSLDLEVGHSATLSATVLPENATNKNKEWSSSNPNIATVSDGLVTAVSPGTCVIKVKTVDGSNLTATCTVAVADIPVSTLSIDKTSIDLLVEEETLITASVYPANATNKALVWSSSNGNVASVDNGKVKALNAGSAVISVRTTDGSDKRETCNVTVRKHPQTIEWNQDLSYITYGGELIELKAVASSGLPVVFSSSNDNVASIIDMGSIVYLNPGNPGSSKITATQGGNYYYESVSVVKDANVIDPSGVENVTDSSEKYTIYDIAGLRIGTYTQQEYDELISNKLIPAGIYIVNGFKKFIGK